MAAAAAASCDRVERYRDKLEAERARWREGDGWNVGQAGRQHKIEWNVVCRRNVFFLRAENFSAINSLISAANTGNNINEVIN